LFICGAVRVLPSLGPFLSSLPIADLGQQQATIIIIDRPTLLFLVLPFSTDAASRLSLSLTLDGVGRRKTNSERYKKKSEKDGP
jgi:hypothetical protein